jgi:hypothetical protein
MMSKIFEFLKSPHILIALATGISIIALAYFSKRVLPREIGFLPSATPPFIMLMYESLHQKYKHRPFSQCMVLDSRDLYIYAYRYSNSPVNLLNKKPNLWIDPVSIFNCKYSTFLRLEDGQVFYIRYFQFPQG